jgi:hypothetical protein
MSKNKSAPKDDKTVYIFLDSDETKMAEIKNIDEIHSLEELM